MRTVTLRQRGRTTSDVNPDATLDDVPAPLLAVVRERGYRLREGDI